MKPVEWLAVLTAWILIAVILTWIAMCPPCDGAELLVGYGQHIRWNSHWCSEATAQSVMEVEIRERITPRLTVGLVGQRLHAEVEPGHIVDGHWYEGNDATAAFHFRLGLQSTRGRFIGEVFGGLGLHSGHQPELGPSQVLGHFGAGLGIRLRSVSIHYRLWHMSDPLQHHDFGWNVQGIYLEIPLW